MTGVLKARTGPGEWIPISSSSDPPTQFWNSAWGVLSHTWTPATTTTIAATAITLAESPPVQLYAGRRYRVRGGVRAWLVPGSGADLTLMVNGPFTPGSNSHDQYTVVSSSYSQAEWVGVLDCTVDTPNAVYTLTATTTVAATLYGGNNGGLTVEDVGPIAMVPTAPPPAADWAPFDARYVSQEDVDAQIAAAISAATAPTRWRVSRAASSIPNGDQCHQGAGTFPESSVPPGTTTWSGSGTIGTPLVVPSAGSYAISQFYSGATFGGSSLSCPIFEAAGSTYMCGTLPQNTTVPMGGTIVVYCEALSTIVFKIRNNTGATVNGVSFRAEVVKVAA